MRLITKITCCAFEDNRPDSENKYLIKYIIDFDGPTTSQIVQTRGHLISIDDVTEEECLSWKISNRDDFLKKLDYEMVEVALKYLGSAVGALSKLTKKEFYFSNNNYHFESRGARKLKPFEMKILMDAYKTK